jgi:hypothetical protein
MSFSTERLLSILGRFFNCMQLQGLFWLFFINVTGTKISDMLRGELRIRQLR